MVTFLERTQTDSLPSLVNITFSSSASPDGTLAFNRTLSQERMTALEDYLRSRVRIPDSLIIRHEAGIDWQTLTQMVEESRMPYRDEVLREIREVPELVLDSDNRPTDGRKKRLMDLRGGRPWHYMEEHFFDSLRYARTVAVTRVHRATASPAGTPTRPTAAGTPDSPAVTATSSGETTAVTASTASADRDPFYMSLKTNMLFDALLLPNIGIEFYLGHDWSISGNWMYGWWDNKGRQRYWRAYGGELAVRRWFGPAAARKPLTGHHLGLYGHIFTYDFEFGNRGEMGGEPGKPLWSRPSYAFGLEYGYSMPIAGRLNIDFVLGVGYLGGSYYKYRPVGNQFVAESLHRRNWLGPTKLEVSLVWLLGHGNSNPRKGGER